MKNIFPLFFVLFFVACDDPNFDSGCLPDSLQDGVIAFYPFTDGSLKDDTSFNHNVINTTPAKPTVDRNGNENCAYSFSNTSSNIEHLTTANTSFLNDLTDFSISLWYLPIDTTRSVEVFESLISRATDSNCAMRDYEWALGLHDCRKAIFNHNHSVWANSIFDIEGSCAEEVVELTNKWHHLVVTKAEDDYKIYFNNILQNSDSGNLNCVEDRGDLFIGKGFKGSIDDIIIYNRAINNAEVTALYELTSCCS